MSQFIVGIISGCTLLIFGRIIVGVLEGRRKRNQLRKYLDLQAAQMDLNLKDLRENQGMMEKGEHTVFLMGENDADIDALVNATFGDIRHEALHALQAFQAARSDLRQAYGCYIDMWKKHDYDSATMLSKQQKNLKKWLPYMVAKQKEALFALNAFREKL